MKLKRIILLTTCLALFNSVQALEAFTGKVTKVEPTYLPSAVSFVMDTGNTTCPAGTWLKWQNIDKDNNKAIYSTLMTALVSGKSVTFHFADGDTTCAGRFLHLLNN